MWHVVLTRQPVALGRGCAAHPELGGDHPIHGAALSMPPAQPRCARHAGKLPPISPRQADGCRRLQQVSGVCICLAWPSLHPGLEGYSLGVPCSRPPRLAWALPGTTPMAASPPGHGLPR